MLRRNPNKFNPNNVTILFCPDDYTKRKDILAYICKLRGESVIQEATISYSFGF